MKTVMILNPTLRRQLEYFSLDISFYTVLADTQPGVPEEPHLYVLWHISGLDCSVTKSTLSRNEPPTHTYVPYL